MAQQTRRSGDNLVFGLYLIFNQKGDVRLTRRYPDLSRDERCLSLSVTLPLALFQAPTLKASLVVDAPAPGIPPIDLTAASEALRGALGVDVEVRVREHDAE